MTFDEDFALRLAAQLEAEDPDPSFKRSRSLSRRQLVAKSYDILTAKRRAGYSLEGIAAQLETLGMPIKVATLERYLRMAARTQNGPPADGRKEHPPRAARHAKATASERRQHTATTGSRGQQTVSAPGGREKDVSRSSRNVGAVVREPPAEIIAGKSAAFAGDRHPERVAEELAKVPGATGGASADDPLPVAGDQPTEVNTLAAPDGSADAAAVPATEAPRALPAAEPALGSSLTGPAGHQSPHSDGTGAGNDREPEAPQHVNVTSPPPAERSNSRTPKDTAGATRPPVNASLLGTIGFMPRR